MMGEQVLPSPKAVKDMLMDLLDRKIVVSTSVPFAPGADGPASIGLYVEDSLRVGAVICFDLRLSAYVGAALGLVPVTEARYVIEDGFLSEAVRENLYEVFNVAATLFNVGSAPHVRLYDVHPAGGPVPPSVLAQALTVGRREDLLVKVAGYGMGRLSLLLI